MIRRWSCRYFAEMVPDLRIFSLSEPLGHLLDSSRPLRRFSTPRLRAIGLAPGHRLHAFTEDNLRQNGGVSGTSRPRAVLDANFAHHLRAMFSTILEIDFLATVTPSLVMVGRRTSSREPRCGLWGRVSPSRRRASWLTPRKIADGLLRNINLFRQVSPILRKPSLPLGARLRECREPRPRALSLLFAIS